MLSFLLFFNLSCDGSKGAKGNVYKLCSGIGPGAIFFFVACWDFIRIVKKLKLV